MDQDLGSRSFLFVISVEGCNCNLLVNSIFCITYASCSCAFLCTVKIRSILVEQIMPCCPVINSGSLLCCQHSRIVPRNNVVHLLNQILTLENDVSCSLLEIAYRNVLVFENGGMLFAYMGIQSHGKIVAIFRNRFTIQQIQHAIQIG